MHVRLAEINEENWAQAAQLQVWEHQKHNAPPAVGLLARAYAYRRSRARVAGFAVNGELAGLALFRDGEGCYTLCFLLVDWRRQGQGVAQAGLERLLALMRREGAFAQVEALVPPDNEIARHIFQKAGFQPDGAERMIFSL